MFNNQNDISQTIAVISVESLGVVQFGSTQKVSVSPILSPLSCMFQIQTYTLVLVLYLLPP